MHSVLWEGRDGIFLQAKDTEPDPSADLPTLTVSPWDSQFRVSS